MPVHIGSTFWSIAVSSAEDDVLSGLTSFRNKLVLVSIILFICGILFSALGVKIWFLFDEIEKRKNAERKTIESEIRLKLAVESAGLGLWNVHEKDGQIWGTDAARALYGFTPEESIHVEDFLSKVHDDDRERVVQSMDEAFQSHKPFSEEYRTILPDGSIRWISANGRYNSTPGMLTGLMGVSTNITERKLIEQSLQKERLFSELVLESLPGIFYLYTIPDMRLIQWNKNHEKMTGFSHEELYNKHVLDWFQPADQEAVRQALATVTDHGSVVMQTDILAKDGGILSLQSTGTLFVDNERQYFMGIGIDVSERLMIEQDLKRYQEHLEELVTERTADLQRARELAETANQAKSTFLTYMSHEIRTPLTAVLGFAHLLERDTSLSTQGHSNTQTIIKSGEYLLSIINDILAMSQIESGQLVLRTTVVDLKQLIYDLAAMFRYRAEEKGIALIIDYSEQMPAFIMADIGKLRQVLINLLGNAFKFTMHGSITMRVYLAGVERIAIEIIDTGIGIAPDEQEKLFLPFVCSGSDEQIPSGTGLGLAISREYAQLMGGLLR
jgi:PAS domain S-box-containing protein